MTDSEIQQPAAEPTTAPRSLRIGRMGCVIVWLILFLTPCALVFLATRGEISIGTGPAPDQRLRIWLVMEAESRGFGISTASAHESGNLTCVQTDVRFLLWQGSAEPSSYCDCYALEADSYTLVSTSSGACTPQR